MPITVWKDLFAKIRDTVDATGGRQIQTLVWHGGEPTLLLESYVNRVLDLQSQMIGDLVADRLVQNAVQTNLYSWTKSLKRMIDEGFHFSVSCDFSPGGRETMGCLDAEKRVWQNLESLLAFDIEVGVLLVLARHNHRHLVDAHDSMEALGVKWLRIVTAFDPMNTAPVGDLILDPGEAVDSLLALWSHRERRPSPMIVVPLDGLSDILSRHTSGIPQCRPCRIRTRVQLDGASDTSPTKAYVTKICENCEFREACDKTWLNEVPPIDEGPCLIGAALLKRLQALSI